MANPLDEFLEGEEGAPASAVAEPAVAEPAAVEGGADPKPKPDLEPPEAGPREEPEHQVPENVAGLKSALQATRRERADYKGERDVLRGELTAIKAQIEELKKPPPPVQAVQERRPVVLPNPVEDPEGYTGHIAQMLFNERLQISEAAMRRADPKADTKALATRFLAEAEKDPRLGTELRQQADPYPWVAEQMQRIDALAEFGADPVAYRARVRAELEAELAGGGQQPSAPAPVLRQSLGTVRSAAPNSRGAPVINIPEDFDDILEPVRNRNRRRD